MNRIMQYLVPAVLTWIIVNYELLSDSYVKPIATIVMICTGVILLLDTGWQVHLKRGGTAKCRELWEIVKADDLLWDKKNSIYVVLLLLSLSTLFSIYPFVTVLLILGTIYAVIHYLGYVGSKYDDNFSDPSGFV